MRSGDRARYSAGDDLRLVEAENDLGRTVLIQQERGKFAGQCLGRAAALANMHQEWAFDSPLMSVTSGASGRTFTISWP